MSLGPDAINALLWLLHQAQQAGWQWLDAWGLTQPLHGQPGWPFAHRLAAEYLLTEPGQSRRLLLALASLLLLALLGALAWRWRRARGWLAGVALVLLLVTPWPDWRLLVRPTVPTAFHQSPNGFNASSIVRGQQLYLAHCQRCHGADGRGEGPDAPGLTMWPPTLNGSLLWKRLDGELFWRIRHGLQDRHGQSTMPASPLSDQQIWDLLDFMRAQAAGQSLRQTGGWMHPVPVPDAAIDCQQGSRRLSSLRGQRLRLLLTGGPGPGATEDPRLFSVAVGQDAASLDCQADSEELAQALAILLGVQPQELPGHQLIADKFGWLRVRGQPGDAQWSEDDLVCRTPGQPVPMSNPINPVQAQTVPADGLDAIIRRIDSEPVRSQRGGFPH